MNSRALPGALPLALLGNLLLSSPGFPAAPSVTCLLEEIELEIQGGGKKAKERRKRISAVHRVDDTSRELESVILPWTFDREPKQAWVTVRNASGTRVDKKLGDFVILPFMREGEFVSDSRVIALALPSLEAGDTVTVFSEYELQPFLGAAPYELGSIHVPHDRVTLRVRVDGDLEPRYRSWNGAGEPETSRDGDTIIWTWNLGPIDLPSPEPYGPPSEDLVPVVSLGVNRIAWGPAGTWEELGRTYFEKISEVVKENDGLPFSELDALGTGAETAGRCLGWVQDQLRYVNIKLGPGGMIPSEPNEIYRRKYGDCKDMSVLLMSLLERHRVPGTFAAVCTRPPAGYRIEPLPPFGTSTIWWSPPKQASGSMPRTTTGPPRVPAPISRAPPL